MNKLIKIYNEDELNNITADNIIEINDDNISILNAIVERNINNRLHIFCDNKEAFNKLLFGNEKLRTYLFQKNNYGDFSLGGSVYTEGFQVYYEYEKKLYSMIEGAKDLSLFEKYIYAYNVTKRFKKYKEDPNYHEQANLHRILDDNNDAIVCLGFARLFSDLLNKLEIENTLIGVEVDDSYDNVNEDDNSVISTRLNGHARVLSHIIDPKYNIDGYYIGDPTWDNSRKYDLYNHLALTDDEITSSFRYFYVDKRIRNDNSFLFDIHSKEEFFQKIYFLIDRVEKDDFEDLFGGVKINETPLEKQNKIISNMLLEILSKIDREFYNFLINKYGINNKKKFFLELEEEKGNELLNEIADYIVTKVNKKIDLSQIMVAIYNVYRNGYNMSEEEAKEKLYETININKKRNDTSYPKRIMFNDDQEIILNDENKFAEDIDISSIHRR